MTNPLSELLNEKGILLADGATGTNLFDMGLTSGDAPELWNVDCPEKIEALHQSFVDAGADIILTNTFGCSRNRMKLHNAEDRIFELNKAGCEIARKVADNADHKVIVAGSVGPTGDLFVPMGDLTMETCVESFVEQMEGMKAGGADVAWAETMSSEEEIAAAQKAAEIVGLELVFTASFDTAGKTMMGLPPVEMGKLAMEMSPRPIAIGANCGVGASDLLSSILDMTSTPHECAVVAKANCGIPQVKGDNVTYTGTPELMADYVKLAVDAGANIIGGCCGTSPEHLAAMRIAIDEHQQRERPDLDQITATIGPMVNSPSVSAEDAPKRERRGTRKR
jgi:5-methyltetrahydrofolate--homocysteine methyltransferase